MYHTNLQKVTLVTVLGIAVLLHFTGAGELGPSETKDPGNAGQETNCSAFTGKTCDTCLSGGSHCVWCASSETCYYVEDTATWPDTSKCSLNSIRIYCWLNILWALLGSLFAFLVVLITCISCMVNRCRDCTEGFCRLKRKTTQAVSSIPATYREREWDRKSRDREEKIQEIRLKYGLTGSRYSKFDNADEES
ncbi:unnamed protein product [Darwinula stevensoni]|uniref:PTTG1IP n=1 Tax=Darwinula stevensoni TaxID=69355 RepID=A0A7R9A550_9CRUS|nr:unnamed protein product [Darwinula stevensoni]CAG0884627.1 unnamed protein product [Darwinula stevensoni]